MDRQALAAAGIDVEDALGRVLGNEQLLSRLLGLFLNDTSLAALEDAIACGDETAAEEAAHTLKGTAGNLSIRPVHETAAAVCDLVRAGSWDEAVALVPRLSAAVNAAQDAIRAGA